MLQLSVATILYFQWQNPTSVQQSDIATISNCVQLIIKIMQQLNAATISNFLQLICYNYVVAKSCNSIKIFALNATLVQQPNIVKIYNYAVKYYNYVAGKCCYNHVVNCCYSIGFLWLNATNIQPSDVAKIHDFTWLNAKIMQQLNTPTISNSLKLNATIVQHPKVATICQILLHLCNRQSILQYRLSCRKMLLH